MRLKIVAGNLAVVVLLGLIAYFTVSSQLRSLRTNELESALDGDRVLLERSIRLSALELEAFVAGRAAQRQLTDISGGLDLDSRRTRAYEAAQATYAWLGDPARGGRGSPDIVAVVDETGRVVARDGARNVMFGKALSPTLPALSAALKTGTTRHDVWLEDEQNKLLQTTIAPIRAETGTVLGALVVGYDLSNGLAANEGKLLGRDVAFIVDGKVYSSSLDVSSARELREFLFGAKVSDTRAVLAGQRSETDPWRIALGGQEYTGVTARLATASSVPVAFAVLGNRTAASQMANVATVILVMLVLGALLVVGYGVFIGTSIMRPIEEIEEGILAVINGKTDLRLATDSAELGGLAFRINQLLNVMTGTEEAAGEDDDGDGGKISGPPSEQAWKDPAFSDSRAQPVAAPSDNTRASIDPDEVIDDPALAENLAGESETAYSDRIYQEYVAAKQSLGENVSSIPKERFSQRLKGRADALVQKHGCRMVRFQVSTENEQVVLRPVVIR
ncbi:MAG: MXAN_5187 C-terminal domain-containing protein [Polyangiales bacterium]